MSPLSLIYKFIHQVVKSKSLMIATRVYLRQDLADDVFRNGQKDFSAEFMDLHLSEELVDLRPVDRVRVSKIVGGKSGPRSLLHFCQHLCLHLWRDRAVVNEDEGGPLHRVRGLQIDQDLLQGRCCVDQRGQNRGREPGSRAAKSYITIDF